jgi:hypothetical protein
MVKMAMTFQEDAVAYLIDDQLLCQSCAQESGMDHGKKIVINSFYGFPPVCHHCGELLAEPRDLTDLFLDPPRYGFRYL